MSDAASLFDPVDEKAARSLLDGLIERSRLYRTSKEYKELLEFVVRLRNFAPFNAMLLQIQKPGLTYAASEADWKNRFKRTLKPGIRPLLILWPFGPVALVYDFADTEGLDTPRDVAAFFARGPIRAPEMATFRALVARKPISWRDLDAGDGSAGSIRCTVRAASQAEQNLYEMLINKNHEPAVQFATLAHELGHLFLGHLGPDKNLRIPERPALDVTQRELEAESVAFLVCARNGVATNSEKYLSDYATQNELVRDLDIYQIMRAAGQIETLLEIGSHTEFKIKADAAT